MLDPPVRPVTPAKVKTKIAAGSTRARSFRVLGSPGSRMSSLLRDRDFSPRTDVPVNSLARPESYSLFPQAKRVSLIPLYFLRYFLLSAIRRVVGAPASCNNRLKHDEACGLQRQLPAGCLRVSLRRFFLARETARLIRLRFDRKLSYSVTRNESCISFATRS